MSDTAERAPSDEAGRLVAEAMGVRFEYWEWGDAELDFPFYWFAYKGKPDVEGFYIPADVVHRLAHIIAVGNTAEAIGEDRRFE